PDRGREIRCRGDAADGRYTRTPWCPLGEKTSHRSLRSSTRPLCGTPLFGRRVRSPPHRRHQSTQVQSFASHVAYEVSPGHRSEFLVNANPIIYAIELTATSRFERSF